MNPATHTRTQTQRGLAVLAASALALLAAGSASALGTWQSSLQPRDLDGDPNTVEAYYDTALNITWLQNTNAGAGSSYDNGKYDHDGRMTWGNATAWAASLTYAGGGWRLPTMIDTGVPGCYAPGEFNMLGGTSCGQNVITTPATPTNYSELGHMFAITLGNRPAWSTSGGMNPHPWLANIGPFSAISEAYDAVNYGDPDDCEDVRDCRDDAYWFNLTDASSPNGRDAWKFLFGEGEQIGDHKSSEFFAWAVHDGDVGTPLNAGFW